MRIKLFLNKSIQENAAKYFDKAKKSKKKLDGAEKTVEETKKKLEKVKPPEIKEKIKSRKKEWYEKFRWFYTSSGKLVVGGRDATTNEIIIKKHTDPDDLVFHTDMAGSPFFVLKDGSEEDKKEVADATATFSRAWKLGIQAQDVFYVKGDQVSKTANPGEFLPKGSFMIRGKTNYIENKVNCCVGIYEGKVMCGPCSAIKKNCKEIIELKQGSKKVSDVAKKIQKKLGGELDEIIRVLPSGGFD